MYSLVLFLLYFTGIKFYGIAAWSKFLYLVPQTVAQHRNRLASTGVPTWSLKEIRAVNFPYLEIFFQLPNFQRF